MLWLAPLALAAGLPDIDTPLKTGASAPDDAAVVVGLADYYELPDVPFADRDAQAFADYLLYSRGVPSDRIVRLPKANREKFLAAVEEAAQRAGSEGTVWVYFAGHGAASPDTGERLLMGIDVQPDLATFAARSIAVDELREAAVAEGSKAVFVIDACYTGKGRTGAELMPGKRFAVPSYAAADRPDIVEWSAASANQVSGPLDGAEHGAFTYAVLGALRGWADGQLDDVRDGVVTAEEAKLYVEEALRSLGVREQVPVLTAEGSREWVLASHPRGEVRPELAPPPPAPAAVPAPGAPTPAPAAPLKGDPRVCFRRNKALGGAVHSMNVKAGDRAVVSVPVGAERCTELPPGSYQFHVTLSGSLLPTKRRINVTLSPGQEAWFLVGFGGALVETPRIVEVSQSQYEAKKFKLLK
jgi:hypothetical protein